MPSDAPSPNSPPASCDYRPASLQICRRLMEALDPSAPPRARLVRRTTHGVGPTGGILGILDASFNPMTLAHERMIEAARGLLELDEVLLLLSSANVDKQVFGADLGQRLAMLLCYADQADGMSVAGCSHARFVDKSEALVPLYPDGTRLTFLIGSDTLVRLFDPKYYTDMALELDRLFSGAEFVVAGRGGACTSDMESLVGRKASRNHAQKIHFISLDPTCAALSSTHVRDRRSRGGPISDLVPKVVEQGIESMNIYRG